MKAINILNSFPAAFDPKYVENTTLLKTLAMYSYIWGSLYEI